MKRHQFSFSITRFVFVVTAVAVVVPPAAAQTRTPPYWASIDEPEARMRTGPSTEYPTMWIYKRKYLPVKIIARYKEWRKLEDKDGTQGWMHARLLSATQTAIIIGKDIQVLTDQPKKGSKVAWRVEPGVVGKISECSRNFCLFDSNGRRGYVNRTIIWGDEPIEQPEGK
jgi:SH3-like domain-containing protein